MENYKPTEEYYTLAERLWTNDFATMDERAELFKIALELSMQDSVRVSVVDQKAFTPYKSSVTVASDLVGQIAGSSLYPYTMRFTGQEGGVMRVAQPGILVEPWNRSPVPTGSTTPCPFAPPATMVSSTIHTLA